MTSKAEQYRQACEAMKVAESIRPQLELASLPGDARAYYNITQNGNLCHNGATLRCEHIPALIAWLRDTFEPRHDDVAEIVKSLAPLPDLPELTDDMGEWLLTRYFGPSDRIVMGTMAIRECLSEVYRAGAAEYKRRVEGIR